MKLADLAVLHVEVLLPAAAFNRLKPGQTVEVVPDAAIGGRYAATVGARSTGDGDPLAPARERALAALSAVLHGYRLGEADRIHALRMLRIPTGVGYETVLGSLSAGRGDVAFREFVMRDVDGGVDKLRVDLTATPSLLAALDTTARPDPRTTGTGALGDEDAVA